MFFARSAAVAALAVSQVAWLSVAVSQVVPLGGEFQVNTYTTAGQYQAAVAADAAGNFVVVWTSANESYETGDVRAQRYDASGAPVGGEFPVNTYTTSDQNRPAVASDSAGNFVVVWSSDGSVGSDTDSYSIQGQRYDASGAPLDGQFQVNSYTTSMQRYPAVTSDSAGNFIVVWTSTGSAGSDSSLFSIQGRRYDASGAPVGGEFQVNSYTTDGQYLPAVAADAAGNVVVVWISDGSAGSDTDSSSIQGQRYDTSGAPVGGQFQVNTYTTGFQGYRPAVAADTAGNFIVAWSSTGSAGSDTFSSIHGQRYDATGVPLGGQFQVNSYTTDGQTRPAVAADAAGNFLVAWRGDHAPSDPLFSVRGQRYDPSGGPVGGEFQVNTYTTGEQVDPAVATDPAGNFIVAWTSSYSTGLDQDFNSVQGQRFALASTTSTSPSSPSTTSTTLPTTDLLPGRLASIRPGTLAKFVAKPVTGDPFALPAANPVAEGGSLRIFDTASTAGDNTYTLRLGASWKGLGKPAGSKGYKYQGAGTASDPCKVVLVKKTVIKAVCQGSGVTLSPPFTGHIGIVLSLGTTDRYCAQFGGEDAKNAGTRTKRKNAPAPGACP